MRIVVIGAGQVGSTIVEALHDDHELTVVDLDKSRLGALSYTFVRVVWRCASLMALARSQ